MFLQKIEYLYQIRKNGEPLFNVDQHGKIGINELHPKYDFVIQGKMMGTDIIIDGVPSLDGLSNEMSIKSGITISNIIKEIFFKLSSGNMNNFKFLY